MPDLRAMQPILQVKDVSKAYAGHVALDGVSLEVPKGSIFGLLGPNGAGKTSLIRIINQITAPDSGTVFFNGQALSPEHQQRIGYLPEERGLYKKMKVGEQALYLAQLKGLSRRDALDRLKHWFVKFEIQDWWNKKVEELSKGMAQKVQFIVTVLHQPELLILDEPFSGFDPINADLIKNEILELKAQGTTIIFSTHNMGSVEELCDHIALINKSKVVLHGAVSAVRSQYRTDTYRIAFKGNVIAFTNALWTGAQLLSKEEINGLTVATLRLLNDNNPNALLQSVLTEVEIHGFEEVIPSMNEIFIKAVTQVDGPLTASSNYTE